MRRHRLAVLVSLAVAVAVGLSACGDDMSEEPDATASTATSTTLGSMPAGDAAIEPGTYLMPSDAWSVTDFSVPFPEGWSVQYGHVFHKHGDEADEFGFYAVVVDEIFDDPCHGDGVPVEVGPGVDDLVAALHEQPGVEVSDPVDTTLGDHPATRVDFAVPVGTDLKDCRLFDDGVEGLQIWKSVPADKYFVLGADMPASAFILDVDGERQVFLTQHHTATSEDDLAELQTVLDSIRIDP
jgi:hypothetical protein